MEVGYFTMPSHPPECGLKEGHDWDLQVLRWLDELGYQEAWIGEHHTAPWEPNPAPDLLIAQALLQTKKLRIGPGGFLLPYHHPAELANRVAMLDHLSEGRLNFGVAASGLPSDWAMFNVDGMSGQNRDMTREALEIILKLWADPAPFTYKGKFWTVTKPDTMFDFLKPHLKPLQAPHPPIGVAGLSKIGYPEACRRARLHPDEPKPQSGLRQQPLGFRRSGSRKNRTQTQSQRLAPGSRGVRRRYR
jgi:alkanesulfonate monooxygenase SsuD/methylene tetrahydromethanopterin reductase-like flavin-dependent oxidoreductase (luciferase family)